MIWKIKGNIDRKDKKAIIKLQIQWSGGTHEEL